MIVITTPTGSIGQQVLASVLDKDEIRVIVRDASKLPPDVRDRIEVIEGSHGERSVVDEAFAGAEAVLWIVPPQPNAASPEDAYVAFSQAACDAFKEQGVKRVVGVSSMGRGYVKDAGYISASLAMDDAIARTGVAYRALTLPTFMDNVLRSAASIKNDGVFFSPIDGDLSIPVVATRDIASRAAALLLDPHWERTESVTLMAADDVTYDGMAKIISDVLGRPVRYQQIPMQAAKERFLGFGYSDAMAQGMIDMMVAQNDGIYADEPHTPQNTAPTSFRTFCEEVLKPAIERV